MFDLESERKHTLEPDLVPILDGLTAVIFFLLLSISFVGLTKVTLPPSVASVAAESKETPLSTRIRAYLDRSTIIVKLDWIGSQPGSLTESVVRVPATEKNLALIEAVQKLTTRFKEKYPEENTLQLSLSENLNYQEMISMMDGALGQLKDIALSSYVDSENSATETEE